MSEMNETITAGGLSVMNQIPNTKPGNLMHHVIVHPISIADKAADLHFYLQRHRVAYWPFFICKVLPSSLIITGENVEMEKVI